MTDLLAASANAQDSGRGWLTLFATVLAAGLVYAGSCAWFPFAPCPKCTGTGRVKRKDGKVFQLCPRCKATGRRLRVGRRVYNFVRAKRKEGSA